jgi:peptide/nickel transport system permease protein
VAAFAVRRLGAAALTIVVVVVLSFVLAHLAPGTPLIGDAERVRADPVQVARLRADFALDRPLPVQLARYAANALAGDLGQSFVRRRPVADLVAERLPATLLLGGSALVLALAFGLAIALLQAARAGTRTDTALGAAALVFYSMPSFWLGLLLLWVFAQGLGWFPVGGMTEPVVHDRLGALGRALDVLRHLALPALTLALVETAAVARFQRGALVDTLRTEFVRAARARGLSSRSVLVRHALRAALAPALALAGVLLPALLAGSVLVETVFGWPGLGRLLQEAIAQRDYNVITACGLVAGVLVTLGSLAADLAAHLLDPRVRR